MYKATKPNNDQIVLFHAVERELKERSDGILTDAECTFIAANFANNYDFSNPAISHKSAGGWAKLLLSQIQAE